ncbi:MAG: ATP synthase F1 subunit delta, partial [Acidobacteriota bacterium]
MGHAAIAGRYARALMDVLTGEEKLTRIETDLATVSTLLEEHGDLREALDRATLPQTRRRRVAEAVFRKTGVDPIVCRLMSLLAEQTREALLPEIRESFRRLCDARRHILPAQVTTAVPLSQDQLEQYKLSLARLTGRQVRLKTEIDPAIL